MVLPQDSAELANVILISIAAYNAAELLIWIFNTFQRRAGLYFISILTATVAQTLFIMGALILDFSASPESQAAAYYILTIMHSISLNANTFVLYSRLYVILPHGSRILRWTLILTVATTAIFVPPQLTLALIWTTLGLKGTPNPSITLATLIFDRTLLATVVVRECIICTIYIVQVRRNLRVIIQAKGEKGRRVMVYLALVQVSVMLIDISLFASVFITSVWKRAYGALVYTIKVKMELGILNALVTLVESSNMTGFGRMSLSQQG